MDPQRGGSWWIHKLKGGSMDPQELEVCGSGRFEIGSTDEVEECPRREEVGQWNERKVSQFNPQNDDPH